MQSSIKGEKISVSITNTSFEYNIVSVYDRAILNFLVSINLIWNIASSITT